MRKLCLACVFLLCAVFFVGCGSVVVGVTQLADGRVVQNVRIHFEKIEQVAVIQNYLDENFGLQNTELRTETIIRENGELHKFYFQMWVREYLTQNFFELELTFANYYSYAWFNGIDLQSVPPTNIETNRGLFFVEHTITMQNPIRAFLESPDNRVMDLINHFNNVFDGNIEDITFVYVLHSNFRRTRVYADEVRNNISTWRYYFISEGTENINDIVIFERRANTTTWYVLGLVLTAIFMGIFFVNEKASSTRN